MSGQPDHKAAIAPERLIGTWTLVSAVREEIPSGAKTDLFGPNPHGFINYSVDGRMIALITRADRKPPADGKATSAEAEALFRSMLGYAGRYTIEGNEVTHHVDISWNESFNGGEQKRHVALQGDRLILSTPQSPDPIDRKLSVRTMTWQRVQAGGASRDGRRAMAIPAATSIIPAPVTSRQVSGSPNTIVPRISATTGETNE
jgi:hypothetical protein